MTPADLWVDLLPRAESARLEIAAHTEEARDDVVRLLGREGRDSHFRGARCWRWAETFATREAAEQYIRRHFAPDVQVNVRTQRQPGADGGLDKRRIVQTWRRFFELLRSEHPGIAIPMRMPGCEAGMVKTLWAEYGEERTIEIFRVAVLDWAIFRQKNPRFGLPDVPTLRLVAYMRRELDAAVASKGVTTTKSPSSRYGRCVGQYDDWLSTVKGPPAASQKVAKSQRVHIPPKVANGA